MYTLPTNYGFDLQDLGPVMDTSDWTQADQEAHKEMVDKRILEGGENLLCPPGEHKFFNTGTSHWICRGDLKQPKSNGKKPPGPLLGILVVSTLGVGGWLIYRLISRRES